MKHFDDLTKIDCPLGELDADTIGRLVRAHLDGGYVDWLTLEGSWGILPSPRWNRDGWYRFVPGTCDWKYSFVMRPGYEGE